MGPAAGMLMTWILLLIFSQFFLVLVLYKLWLVSRDGGFALWQPAWKRKAADAAGGIELVSVPSSAAPSAAAPYTGPTPPAVPRVLSSAPFTAFLQLLVVVLTLSSLCANTWSLFSYTYDAWLSEDIVFHIVIEESFSLTGIDLFLEENGMAQRTSYRYADCGSDSSREEDLWNTGVGNFANSPASPQCVNLNAAGVLIILHGIAVIVAGSFILTKRCVDCSAWINVWRAERAAAASRSAPAAEHEHPFSSSSLAASPSVAGPPPSPVVGGRFGSATVTALLQGVFSSHASFATSWSLALLQCVWLFFINVLWEVVVCVNFDAHQLVFRNVGPSFVMAFIAFLLSLIVLPCMAYEASQIEMDGAPQRFTKEEKQVQAWQRLGMGGAGFGLVGQHATAAAAAAQHQPHPLPLSAVLERMDLSVDDQVLLVEHYSSRPVHTVQLLLDARADVQTALVQRRLAQLQQPPQQLQSPRRQRQHQHPRLPEEAGPGDDFESVGRLC